MFTTIPISEMNHIMNGMLYGFHVTYMPIFAQSSAVRIEYKIIKGFQNELNSKTKMANTKNNARPRAENVA